MLHFLTKSCQTGKMLAHLNLGSEVTQPSPNSWSVATAAEETSFLPELASIKMGRFPLQWCHGHFCNKPTSGHGRLPAGSQQPHGHLHLFTLWVAV